MKKTKYIQLCLIAFSLFLCNDTTSFAEESFGKTSIPLASEIVDKGTFNKDPRIQGRITTYPKFTTVSREGIYLDATKLPAHYGVERKSTNSAVLHNGVAVKVYPDPSSNMKGGKVTVTNAGVDNTGREFDTTFTLPDNTTIFYSYRYELRMYMNDTERILKITRTYKDGTLVKVPIVMKWEFAENFMPIFNEQDIFTVITATNIGSGATAEQFGKSGYYDTTAEKTRFYVAGHEGTNGWNGSALYITVPQLEVNMRTRIGSFSESHLLEWAGDGIEMEPSDPGAEAPVDKKGVIKGATIADFTKKNQLFTAEITLNKAPFPTKNLIFEFELDHDLIVEKKDVTMKTTFMGMNYPILDFFDMTHENGMLRFEYNKSQGEELPSYMYGQPIQFTVAGQLDLETSDHWGPLIDEDGKLTYKAVFDTKLVMTIGDHDIEGVSRSNEDKMTFTNVKIPEKEPATLTIKYVDENNRKIAEDVIKDGFVGDFYEFIPDEIQGYTYIGEIEKFSGQFTKEAQEFILTYQMNDRFLIEQTVTKGSNSAEEVYLGDTLTYQLVLTSKLLEVDPAIYYDGVTLESSSISPYLEKVNNLKLTNKEGVTVGSIEYDTESNKVVGKINAVDKVKSTENLVLSYEATVKDSTAIESEINMSGSIKGKLSSGSIIEDKQSNKVTSIIKNGGLVINSYPESLSFGTLNISADQVDYPVSTLQNELSIKDLRGNGNNWKMTAKLLTDLEDKETNRELTEAMYYKFGDNTPQVMTKNSSVLVSESETVSSAPVVLSKEWTNKKNPTLLLKLKGGQAKVGEYTGDIQWSLEDVPLNAIKR